MASPADSAEQRAAKRKSHRKSRNGCFQCKQRHTKCNETHPRCSNCIRLDIECTWPARERFSTTTYPTPPDSHGSVLGENPTLHTLDTTIDNFGSDMSLADLRLLHHWTTRTCEVMSPDLKRRNAWMTSHVEIALDHPFLLRGILAVAAVHKALTDPRGDKNNLLYLADCHISKALTIYRQKLEQQNPETAVPMFVLSTILVIYNLALAQVVKPEDPVNAMAHCFRLIQGVFVVVKPNWNYLMTSTVFTDMAIFPVTIETIRPIPEILRLKKLTETKKTPAGAVHIEAIDELHRVYMQTLERTIDEDRLCVAFTWTSTLSDAFTSQLTAHDPIAVLVLSYFAALLSQCQDSWWLRGIPHHILATAQKLLMSTPELLDYLDWPLQIINANTAR